MQRPHSEIRLRELRAIEYGEAVEAARDWIASHGRLPKPREWEKATPEHPSTRTIRRRWSWERVMSDAAGESAEGARLAARRRELLLALRKARDELGFWPARRMFALTRTSIDYDRLLEVAEECAAKGGLLSPELATEAQTVLAASEGELLPIWEELEQAVNGARGAAGEFVLELRQQAEEASVTILGALAANHLARHEPEAAVPLLERGLERQPEREDLARKLRMGYLETGQHGRAAEIQKAHALEA